MKPVNYIKKCLFFHNTIFAWELSRSVTRLIWFCRSCYTVTNQGWNIRSSLADKFNRKRIKRERYRVIWFWTWQFGLKPDFKGLNGHEQGQYCSINLPCQVLLFVWIESRNNTIYYFIVYGVTFILIIVLVRTSFRNLRMTWAASFCLLI
jgi:hypothetical protein